MAGGFSINFSNLEKFKKFIINNKLRKKKKNFIRAQPLYFMHLL